MARLAHLCACPGCQSAWIREQTDALREKAAQAAKLYNDACEELRRLEGEGHQAHALVRLGAANADGDDILLQCGTRIPLLRQQHTDPDRPCLCLSDFILPLGKGRTDRIGLFASSTDRAVEESHPDDPYRHLLAQTLADRLAEACIEKAHQHVRTTLWGYAPDENLTPDELFSEQFQGIRPAVGYPSLPDQSLNFLLDELLGFRQIGISLTENGAMQPHASTSGLMLAHPAARHFRVGPVAPDQLADYARRRGMEIDRLRRFLNNSQ